MRSFGSDNHAGVHPLIMESILKANSDHAAAYGTDTLSKELSSVVKNILGEDWHWFHCFNGTAANVICLKSLVKSHQSVLCSEVSHLNLDECGAPEFHIGSKLITLKHKNGKICLKDAKLKITRLGDQHFSQVKALSITQPTELGTSYSEKELEETAQFCKENNLFLHIDGARIPNASHSTKLAVKKMIAHADAVSFGGTKNGLFGSELVLVKKEYAQDVKFIRKQSMQLPSKTRFLAAQFLRFFQDDLYLKIAEHSCSMAIYLKEQIEKNTDLKANYRVESKAVFINFPKEILSELRKERFFYIWDDQTFEARLMTSFDTTKEEIDGFVVKLNALLKP